MLDADVLSRTVESEVNMTYIRGVGEHCNVEVLDGTDNNLETKSRETTTECRVKSLQIAAVVDTRPPAMP